MSTQELISFVEALNRCWLEQRYGDLGDYLAEDVVFVAPGGNPRLEGIAKAVDSYREFMSRAVVHRFEPSNYAATDRGDTAVVEHDWRMAWESAGQTFDATGRDLLVLARRDAVWRVVWRTQIPDGS